MVKTNFAIEYARMKIINGMQLGSVALINTTLQLSAHPGREQVAV
jgi:hypothetical protein